MAFSEFFFNFQHLFAHWISIEPKMTFLKNDSKPCGIDRAHRVV
jgi:hypothetical protein